MDRYLTKAGKMDQRRLCELDGDDNDIDDMMGMFASTGQIAGFACTKPRGVNKGRDFGKRAF